MYLCTVASKQPLKTHKIMLNYFLLYVGRKGVRFEKPCLISLHGKPKESKERTISWMRIGQGEHDIYKFCKRISKTSFQCVDTNEIFEIKENIGWTVEAWERFLNDYLDLI